MGPLSNHTDPLTAIAEYENLTLGTSSSYNDNSRYAIVRNVQTVLLPFIFLFGILGNLLALGCFLSQSLRATSCCLYMAAKCVSDTVFLASLFVMWLHRVHVDAVHVQGVCQITVYLSYLSGFSSVWLVLAITYENYIRICRPHLVNSHCTRRVALLVIGVIVGFAVVCYSFALWTNDVIPGSVVTEQPLCMAMSKFKDVLMVMTFVDTVTTLVLPSLIIIPLVLATLVGVARALDRKNRLQDALLGNKGSRNFMNSMEVKVARFLLAVSLTFLLLHTPGHLIRLKLLVDQYLLHKDLTDMDATLQRLLETLYYFNFCCSVVIFLASGANFRAIFLTMYCRRFVVKPSSSAAAKAMTGMMLKKRKATGDGSTNTSFVEHGSFRRDGSYQ